MPVKMKDEITVKVQNMFPNQQEIYGKRFRRWGKHPTGKCSKCDRKHFTRGFCEYHLKRFIKDFIYDYFGRKCVNCREDDIDILDLDHIENDGSKDRKTGKRGYQNWEDRYQIFRKILSNQNLKKKYQILCKNCNWKKHIINIEFKRLEKLKVSPF